MRHREYSSISLTGTEDENGKEAEAEQDRGQRR